MGWRERVSSSPPWAGGRRSLQQWREIAKNGWAGLEGVGAGLEGTVPQDLRGAILHRFALGGNGGDENIRGGAACETTAPCC